MNENDKKIIKELELKIKILEEEIKDLKKTDDKAQLNAWKIKQQIIGE